MANNILAGILIFETVFCFVAAGFLAHSLPRRPEHRGLALYLHLSSAAFLWLLVVDLLSMVLDKFDPSWRALIFRALMAGGFGYLLTVLRHYR